MASRDITSEGGSVETLGCLLEAKTNEAENQEAQIEEGQGIIEVGSEEVSPWRSSGGHLAAQICAHTSLAA